MKLNGKDIYFRDKCFNIVTVVNKLDTTTNSTSSVPVVVAINT